MPGYAVREIHQAVGHRPYPLRVLSERQQFGAPDGCGSKIGISSAQLRLFGQLWPAGRSLRQCSDSTFGEGKSLNRDAAWHFHPCRGDVEAPTLIPSPKNLLTTTQR